MIWIEIIKMVIIVLAIFMAFFMACYIVMSRRAKILRVVNEDFTRENDQKEPVRFACISDLHLELLPISWRNIAETVRDEEPNFVVVAGDIFARKETIQKALTFLDYLGKTVRCPIYIVFGNHDNAAFKGDEHAKGECIKAIENISYNIHVIENQYSVYGDVLIGGLEDCCTNAGDVDGMLQKWTQYAQENGLRTVLVSHNPDILLEMKNKPQNISVMVSGHTHGGQVWMPLRFEFLVLRNDKLPKKGIYYGKHIVDGIPLYISCGIGCSLMPIRFKTCAEVAMITI